MSPYTLRQHAFLRNFCIPFALRRFRATSTLTIDSPASCAYDLYVNIRRPEPAPLLP